MHIQQLLVNRLRIGTGTAKCPSETPLLTSSIPNTAPALISFEERKFALVLFITLAPLHLSNSCHFLSQGELLEPKARVSAHAAEIRDAHGNRRQICLQIPGHSFQGNGIIQRHKSEQSLGHAGINYTRRCSWHRRLSNVTWNTSSAKHSVHAKTSSQIYRLTREE